MRLAVRFKPVIDQTEYRPDGTKAAARVRSNLGALACEVIPTSMHQKRWFYKQNRSYRELG